MKITDELLEKYAAGSCSDIEKDIVEKWLASNSDLEGDDYAHLYQSHHEEEKKRFVNYLKNTNRNTLHLRLIVRYAAAAVFLIVISISSFFLFNDVSLNGTADSITYENYKITEAHRGEKRVVKLPDGSTVHLNYETKLRIPEQFNGRERIVFLEGHAHFDIARNIDRPFIIYTENSKTRVLGTSFDINTNSITDGTEVIVASGKVEFSEKAQKSNKVVLTVDDRAVLFPNQNIGVSVVDAKALTSWKDGQLIFNYQSLAEIIRVLEPWYDINITVKNPELLNKTYKFSQNNPSLETLMKQMSFIADFNYTIEGKQVTIY